MANETIELLKNYDPSKMKWPAGHQEKLDGVPVIIKYIDGTLTALTRQGEPVFSIPHILSELERELFTGVGVHNEIIGELYIEGVPFKDISGFVRRKFASTDLRLHIFDFNCMLITGWYDRMNALRRFMYRTYDTFTIIPWVVVDNAAEAERAHEILMLANPKAEGSVLHSCRKAWEPGKRSWLVQRMKPKPTLDLKVLSFEEAIGADGTPLGRVGRINVELVTEFLSGAPSTTQIVGVGPGKLTHKEAEELWQLQLDDTWKLQLTETYLTGVHLIAEVQYMKDDAYDALRQPTWQRWRPDKRTPDIYTRD